MGYMITKTIVKKCDVLNIWRFQEFGVFRASREYYGLSVERKCFCCGREFHNDDILYLGPVRNEGNKLFCEKCGKEIAESLGIEDKHLLINEN